MFGAAWENEQQEMSGQHRPWTPRKIDVQQQYYYPLEGYDLMSLAPHRLMTLLSIICASEPSLSKKGILSFLLFNSYQVISIHFPTVPSLPFPKFPARVLLYAIHKSQSRHIERRRKILEEFQIHPETCWESQENSNIHPHSIVAPSTSSPFQNWTCYPVADTNSRLFMKPQAGFLSWDNYVLLI